MIPKIIHYCWFGGKPKPQKVLECIETWKKYLPDFKIMEWNESNFDYRKIKYTREAYAVKKYAFVSDVARLYVLYEFGGIYFDTDIIVLKKFSNLLYDKSFLGYESNNVIGTGVIGAEKKTDWILDFYNSYKTISFITKYGNLDLLPNTLRIKELSLFKELKFDNQELVINQQVHIYPFEFFCAKDFKTKKYLANNSTYCIHDYSGTWLQTKQLTILMRLKNILKKYQCNK